MDKKSVGPDPRDSAESGGPGDAASGSAAAVPKEIAPAASDTSGARRPMRLTPGSGGYTALLAHSRPKPRTGDVPIAAPAVGTAGGNAAGPGSVAPAAGQKGSDALEITAVAGGAVVPAAAGLKSAAPAFDESAPTLVARGGSRSEKKAVTIPRPTRLTPGGLGGVPLSALSESATARPTAGATGANSDAAELQETPKPVAKAPAPAGIDGPPAPQSVAESKNSVFATTIHGVTRPELTGAALPGTSSSADRWIRPAAGAGAGEPRSDGGGAITFTPVAVEDGKLTERNAAPAYSDSGPVGFSGSSSFSDGGTYDWTLTAVEGPRITARIDASSSPARGKRRALVAAVATGAAVVALGVAWPRLWRQWHQGDGGGGEQGRSQAVPSQPAPSSAAAEPPVPPPVAAPAAPVPATVPPAAPATAAAPAEPAIAPAAAPVESPPAAVPSAAAAPEAAQKAEKSLTAAPTAEPSGDTAEGVASAAEAAATLDGATAPASSKARSRSRAARAEARLLRANARAKAKQKKLEARAARKQAALSAAAEARPVAPAHAKSAPPLDGDPDGTLPLTGR